MAPAGHPSGGQGKKPKPASKETLRKPVPKEKLKSASGSTFGKPASKEKLKSASGGPQEKPATKEKPKSSSKPRDQTSSNCFGNIIFLSDSDREEQPQSLPSRNAERSKSDSDPDSVQLISSPALIGTTATSNSATRMGNRRGRGSRGRGSRGRGAIHVLNALSLLQNNASANLQHVIGTLNLASFANIWQPGSNAASSSRASPRKTKKNRKNKKELPVPTESDDASSSDSYCLLGMSPRRSHKTSHKSVGKGKKMAREVKKKCNNSKPNATINCDSDSWSYNSSSDDESKKDKTSDARKKQNVAAAVGGNVTAKPKVTTNWSDDEELEDIKVLPEAAIFSNRIESYKEQMKELRKKEWFAKESLMEEIAGNKKTSTAASKITKKRKVTEKKKSSTSSDDSEAEIAAKIPVVTPQAASNSDDDECNIKLDETITEEHISKTVRNRIERKIKKMQEEQKEILAIPTSYGCSSDDEDADLQCLSDREVDPEIVVKVRWQHKLVKIPMRSNETFAKVFNEIAKMNDLEVSSIMLLLRDKIVNLNDTPKLLNATTCDIFDSCILNAREEASDTTVKANYVQIKMQSNDSKVKIPFTIHKLEPMSIVMQEYSMKRNIPLEKMIFKFDGEKIDPNASPFDLDMEDESCIDVKIS